MMPVIALVGRPNVGKSTLFNRITRTRDAIVADYSGLTRDRKYGAAEINGQRCWVIDTGGISGEEEGIDAEMASQSRLAMEEADCILFILDGRQGLTPVDENLAKYLRSQSKPVVLVINKCDGLDENTILGEFYRLGLGEPYPMSASHGRGVKSLFEMVAESLYQSDEVEDDSSEDDSSREDDDAAFLDGKDYEDEDEEGGENGENAEIADDDSESRAAEINRIRMAVIGRPNVGKSTLVNRLLGEERVVVFDQPGTTRDSIYIDFEREDRQYTLIDTAGIRKRKNIDLAIEKFSIVKTLQAIDDAHVVLLLVDAQVGLVEQDLHLLGLVIDAGRALVIVINKWDGLDVDQRERIKSEVDRRLNFVQYANVHYISALHGSGVGNLYESIHQSYRSAFERFSTQRITRLLEDAIKEHAPPLANGRRIKMRYAHFGGNNPPRIIIHGSLVDSTPGHYTRYLEKVFRRELDLSGTPVVVEYRQGENPYAGKRNTLTPRQVKKRQRLVKHIKKSKR